MRQHGFKLHFAPKERRNMGFWFGKQHMLSPKYMAPIYVLLHGHRRMPAQITRIMPVTPG